MTYEYFCEKCGVFEFIQGIKEDTLTTCPKCGKTGLQRLVSLPAAFLFKGRQMNQYGDVLHAKYWVDADGNKHKVTAADGSTNSPTVSRKRKRSDEQVKAIKKRNDQLSRAKRQRESYRRYVKNVMRNRKK